MPGADRLAGRDRAEVPAAVLAAYGWGDAEAAPLGTGLINDTYLVSRGGAPVAVLQRLHPVFRAEVNIDLDAVTSHLASQGLTTPRLIVTRDGKRWVDTGDRPWRATTYVPGLCFDEVDSPVMARAAGQVVGRFHRAVSTLEHRYVHVRTGVHDTAAHLAKLARLREQAHATPAGPADEAVDMAAEIAGAAAEIPHWADLPRRHAHGDLKISNVIFDGDVSRGLCLIDLDTCGLQTVPYELGDALRSWCNRAGESGGTPIFDVELLSAAMAGYADGSRGLLTREETATIVAGIRTVCVELAARFCADVFEDCYFGWDPSRFSSRREHNLVRARGQLSLAASLAAQAEDAEEAVAAAFDPARCQHSS